MVTLDMAGLSDRDLENIVAQHCSQFGTVKSLRILPPDDLVAYPIALVQMSSAAGLDAVSAAMGDSKYHFTVTIKLKHDDKPIHAPGSTFATI